MRYASKLFGILVIVALFAMTAGCGGGGGSSPAAAPTLATITITTPSTTLPLGGSETLAATGHYSDGSSKDVTASATWTSSAPAVATVNSSGTVVAVTAGSSTRITATVGSISGFVDITVTSAANPGANVMAVSVNGSAASGSLCSDQTTDGYFNKPCVSVTICTPDNSVCKTVNDILLDTGSYGLRIFQSALPGTMNLPQAVSGLAECINFADGSQIWGPVVTASVQLGTEPSVQMPIQLINASYGSRGSICGSADATPVAAQFTGVLGVGVFNTDCGSGCVNSPNNGVYFLCSGSNCSGTTVSIANQVKNPVSQLPVDNNGLILQLPQVSTSGATATSGSLFLGIGTQANNTLSAGTGVFPTDSSGDIITTFNGVTFDATRGGSFVDSGSNGYFIPNVDPANLPVCGSPNSVWYCPPSTKALTSTVTGAFGSPSAAVPFTVGNFNGLMSNASNMVFNDIAGTSTFGFDYGLPFFFGKNVFVGINGKQGLGTTGPFVGF